ncbi:MAG: Xaa-Pro aminopeptidase [Pseudomonadota bacterium]
MQPVIPQDEFLQRRQRVIQQLPDNVVTLVAASDELTRSNDTEYPFRQNSYFHYLTGFNEPDAVLVLSTLQEQPGSVLFCQNKDPDAEVWHGLRLGYLNAPNALGIDVGYDIEQLDERLAEILNGAESVFLILGENESLEHQVHQAMAYLRETEKRGNKVPHRIDDLRPMIDQMRQRKSAHELSVMREAARISCGAFKRIMKYVQPGVYEYQLGAELHHEFAVNGALYPAYGMICGGGSNACVLHYTDNRDQLHDGDLVLVDAGAEYQGYAADITRTFPVNGKFSDEQKLLYDLVLKAQLAAFEEIKPGSDLVTATAAAARVINDGLTELEILTGDADENFEQQQWKKYFIHGLSHWLGLDVHDVGRYKDTQNEPLKLQPGMVITVEPGIYIAPDSGADERWRGMGIRIEDDLIITADGFENMTESVPKTTEEIEAWMQKL